MYFSLNNIDYWYEIHGDGRPVVLLHGFTGSSVSWNHLIGSRPSGYQFITVDLPGHGRTKGKRVRTMEACVDDLNHLFQHLELERFILLGYSMGGRTALSYATMFPKNLSALILESASPGLADADRRAERKANDEKLANWIEEEGLTAFVDYWEDIPLFHTQKQLSKKVQTAIRSERLAQSEIGLASSLRGMGTGSQLSNWEKLHTLKIPVLLLAGEWDEKFIAINQEMEQKLPQAELKIFPAAGHALHIENPALFKETVLAFAKNIGT